MRISHAPILAGFFSAAAFAQLERPTPADLTELTRRAVEQLHLRDAEVVAVSAQNFDDATMQVRLPINGQERVLDLQPSSVVSPEYQLIVQVGEDDYVEGTPTRVPLYRGSIAGLPDSDVALTRVAAGLEGLVQFPDGSRVWIEPLAGRVASATNDQHVLYRDADLLVGAAECDAGTANRPFPAGSETDSGSTASGLVYVAQIAADTDVEYFLKYGSVSAVEAQIQKVIHNMNVQYERDVQIRHLINRIIVRTVQPDPYSGESVATLINQVSQHWNGAQAGVARDAVQMFTGRDINVGGVGIAILDSMCALSAAYSVVWGEFNGCEPLACKTDLSAHELGHIWSANHCNCLGWTMNPSLQSANRFHPTFDIPVIKQFRNIMTCLHFMDKCLATGTPDCNQNGVADPCDIASQTSPDVDANAVPDECQPPPMPETDASGIYANRTIDVKSPTAPTLVPGTPTALRVGLFELYNSTSPGENPPDFSAYEEGASCTDSAGCGRWLGPPFSVPISSNNQGGPTMRVSRLQCTPHYRDWTIEDFVHVIGAEILPSSFYTLRSYLNLCQGNEAACDLVSSTNLAITSQYGDVASPFAPGALAQPDALDTVAIVNGFRGVSGAPTKRFLKLQPSLVDMNTAVDALDIIQVVDGFIGRDFPFAGPCPCPSTVTCNATACTTDANCSGGLCIRACLGGSLNEQPCRTDADCPDATCGPAFCRDRCGRCSP